VSEPRATALTDLHSHLVPGVDDGARTIEDVLEGVGRMVARGVGRIITTPHLDASLTQDPELLNRVLAPVDEAWEAARAAVAERFPALEFRRGHEILLDVPDPDFSDPRVRLAGGPVALVEWPGLQIPPSTTRVLGEFREAGIRPLIAHVERYRGFDADLSLPSQWREEGAWLQMNYGSLVGRYGSDVRHTAIRLLEEGWVDCMASDFHGRPHLRLYIEEARRVFEELDAMEEWTLMAAINPHRISGGEEPRPVRPIPFPRTVLARLKEFFGAGR
jgi:protein-tyrosine phosphatase